MADKETEGVQDAGKNLVNRKRAPRKIRSHRVWNELLASERIRTGTDLVERTGNPVIVERKVSPERVIVLREEKNLPTVVKV